LAIQLSAVNTPLGNLSFCCCTVLRSVKIQSYANQSESGEARVAGSNSGVAVMRLFYEVIQRSGAWMHRLQT
ncbi:MAG: hypothetical protein P8074_27885, partial [Anaerolineales bacterium]